MYVFHSNPNFDYRFEWHGGNYIEVLKRNESQTDYKPFDVINVWDYSKDTPRIPDTVEGFMQECKSYLADLQLLD